MTTLTHVLPDFPVADAPGSRDGFVQMLATLEAQLDRDLAGPAPPAPVQPATPVPPPLTPAAPSPRPASALGPQPRSMLAPAAAVVATIAVVGFAALLIALHWRPTRSLASSVPVASLSLPVTAAATSAAVAAPGPLALATRVEAAAPGVEATLADPSCTQVQTALGLCKALAPRSNPTTTPESTP